MSPRDCHYDARGCYVCPAIPGVPGVPGHYDIKQLIGWSAGANSQLMLDGNIHAVFPMKAGIAGCVIGFKDSRLSQTVPARISRGLYFTSSAGANFVSVRENGVQKTAAVQYAEDDVFEIRRVDGLVSYRHGDAVLYTSQIQSVGAVIVNACLYASGDTVE